MTTQVLNLNEDATRVMRYFLTEDFLENRIDAIEQATDLLLETSQGVITDDEATYLKLIAEFRSMVKDFRTILGSLRETTT